MRTTMMTPPGYMKPSLWCRIGIHWHYKFGPHRILHCPHSPDCSIHRDSWRSLRICVDCGYEWL